MGCLPLNQLNMMTVDEDNTHSAVSAAEELLRRTSYFPDYVASDVRCHAPSPDVKRNYLHILTKSV